MSTFSRKPVLDDASPRQNPWGATGDEDDTYLLICSRGKRCSGCGRVTKNMYLEADVCPDCYREAHGIESPAIARVQEQQARQRGYCACGEDGEAD